MTPAFTAVSLRPSLAMKKSSNPALSGDFTPEIIDYVQRAFLEFNRAKSTGEIEGISADEHRKRLFDIVDKSKQQGTDKGRDWSTWPLPSVWMLQEQQERERRQGRRHAQVHAGQRPVIANKNHYSSAPKSPHTLLPTSVGQKRKSPEPDLTEQDVDPITPPLKKKDNKTQTSLADGVTGKSKKQDKKRKESDKLPSNVFDSSQDALERRRQRFGVISPEPSPRLPFRIDPPSETSAGPIVGTCQTLEKGYFRLTAPPHHSAVRPLPILEQALEYVISVWQRKHDYGYICDQLKSIRQDLTVQRIKTPFTIRVYEVHARIALEMQDMGEYNQCQTQLRGLYKLRLGEGGSSSGGSDDEFLAYRILYLIYTNSRADMNGMLADLTKAEKQKPFASYALAVRAALAAGNYHKLFRLYKQSPSIGLTRPLMALFIERERLGALSVMSKTYKPDVGLDFVAAELGFSADAESAASSTSSECAEFIIKYQGESLLQQNSDGKQRILTGRAGTLFEDAKRAAFSKVDIKGQI